MNQKEFGTKICTLRKARGMTQAQLAEMLHVSNKAVSRWETGEGYPEITLLSPLARALGVSVDELLSDDESEKSSETSAASSQDEPDGPFHKQDGKQFYHSEGAGKAGKKEYKHRDIPVVWPKFSFAIRKLRTDRTLCLLDMAVYVYFIALVCVLYSANMALRYLSNKSWHWGQFSTPQMGYIFLGIAAVIGIGLIGLHAYYIGRDSRCFSYVRNMVFLIASLLSAFLCLKPVQGVMSENREEALLNYKPGAWLSCDFFQVNRKFILIMTVVLVLFYMISTVIHAFWSRKKKACSPCEDGIESEKEEKMGKGSFWRSLIVFNKISWVCLIISFVCIAMYLIMCIFITLFQDQFVNLYYFVTGSSTIITIITTVISSIASKVGIISGLIGIGAGLFDACDRQIKASVIFVIANFVLMYVPTLLIIASQGMAFMSFFDSGTVKIDPFF